MKLVRRYGFAIGVVVLATFVQRELWPYIPPSPQLFFFPAVVLIAWKEGLLTSLFSVALSVFAMAFFFLDPPMSIAVGDPRDQVDLLLFCVMSTVICVLVSRTRDAEQRARLVFDEVPVGIMWTLGRDGKRTEVNAYARKLLGLSSTKTLVPPLTGAVRTADGRELTLSERPRLRALAGERVSAEIELELHDGTRVPVLESAVPFRNRDGKIEGALVAFQDISALKEVEVLRRQWNTLIAHDLRSPLHVILMSAGALRIGSDSPHIARIERATRRLDRIVRDLLDASRLEVHQLPLVKSEVDLVEVVKECVAEHEEAVIELLVRGETKRISADRDRIEQVIDNLLTNAVKYGSKGTKIGIEVAQVDDRISVSVTNRGPGISEIDRGALFQRFRRLGDRNKPGIGVGLYIARGLVEAHAGTIECESVVDDKTTFRVTLPA